ncbi:MAG: acyltransferase family protein [Solirubrobacteraceae bacterium]
MAASRPARTPPGTVTDRAGSPALAPPPGNPRFPLVDACRGAACLAVVVAHGVVHKGSGWAVNLGEGLAVAVPVFFALSGFLLLRPYLAALAAGGSGPRLGDYVQRRALRILPGYWVALILSGAVLGAQFAPGVFGDRWWNYFGLVQVYSLTHNYDGIATAWSLCVDMTFYALLPLLVFAGSRLGRRVGWRAGMLALVLPMLVIGPVIHLLNTVSFSPGVVVFIERITYALPGECNFFAIGMVLAILSVDVEHGRGLPRPLAWLTEHAGVAWLAMLAIFLASSQWAGFVTPEPLPGLGVLDFRTRFLASDLSEMAIVLLLLLPAAFPAARERPPHRILASRVLGFASLISYGLYLYHWQIGQWLLHETALGHVMSWPLAARWPLMAAVLILSGGLLGTASYYIVELPFLRRKPGWTPAAPRVAPRPAQPGLSTTTAGELPVAFPLARPAAPDRPPRGPRTPSA